jgi:hypothetical protein
MKVQSEIFRDENYASLVDRIEAVLELLIKQGNHIISVTISAETHPSDYFIGTIFYQEAK